MLWEVMAGRTLARLTGHTDEVWGLAFFPKQPRVVSASWDLTLKLWDVTTVAGAPEHTLPVQESTSAMPATGEVSEYPMITCSCSPDGTRFVAGSADGSLRLWDATTGSALAGVYGGEEA
jgi:WD40 repeat protein